MKYIRLFLLYLWQLPQNIIGLAIGCITSFKKNPRGYYEWNLFSGISLGSYIFLNRLADDSSVSHEKGHQIQSAYLGPLYLLIIGLPSFIWCALHTYTALSNKDYYSFYTESWADKLGKVTRY